MVRLWAQVRRITDSEPPALEYKEQKNHVKNVSFLLIICIMNNFNNV